MHQTIKSIDVQLINEREQWNTFLTDHQQGHLLHSYEWGELHRYLGADVYRLGAFEQGRMVGAMLLTTAPVPLPVKIPGLHLKWLYCCRGPVVESPQSPALAALVEKAHTIARKERALVLRLEPNIDEADPDKDAWLAAYHALGFHVNPIAIHARSSWVLDLRPDLNKLRAGFRKAWRQNIRIAENMNVVVREAATEADFDTYYDLLTVTSKRDHFFIHGKDYHREILRQFTDQGKAVLFLAECEGEAVAAKMLIKYGDWCWDMFAGSSNSRPELPKSHIVQYHSLKWAKEQGCTYFDFRSIPDILEPDQEMWGIYHYKKGFGGFARKHIQTLDYIYQPLIYHAWRLSVEARREMRRRQHKKQALKKVQEKAKSQS